MRKTLEILDQELRRLSQLINKIDTAKLTVQQGGIDTTTIHREELIVMLSDLLEVRSRITMKMAAAIDARSKNALPATALSIEAVVASLRGETEP